MLDESMIIDNESNEPVKLAVILEQHDKQGIKVIRAEICRTLWILLTV
jgi:hypothetical protein